MIRCEDGHLYDPAKHTSCPWCSKPLDLGGTTGPDLSAGKTKPLRPQEDKPAVDNRTAPMPGPGRAAAAEGATRGIVAEKLGMEPVVGWLVCLDGPERGRDFRLKPEKNFIGRAPNMHICIAGDAQVSREKHATITFEPKKQVFWLIPGDASGLVYLNGDLVNTPTQLKDRDAIELGQSKLVLVPFVNESFRWE